MKRANLYTLILVVTVFPLFCFAAVSANASVSADQK